MDGVHLGGKPHTTQKIAAIVDGDSIYTVGIEGDDSLVYVVAVDYRHAGRGLYCPVVISAAPQWKTVFEEFSLAEFFLSHYADVIGYYGYLYGHNTVAHILIAKCTVESDCPITAGWIVPQHLNGWSALTCRDDTPIYNPDVRTTCNVESRVFCCRSPTNSAIT